MQWLCNADKSSHNPHLRLKYDVFLIYYTFFSNVCKAYGNLLHFSLLLYNFFLFLCRAFFTSLYKCLTNGARAVFQVYPENDDQRELLSGAALKAGFSGGTVVDYKDRYE